MSPAGLYTCRPPGRLTGQETVTPNNVALICLLGVKGPKKIFPDMPFGNMDSDKIEARKGLLETFLKVSGFLNVFFFFINLVNDSLINAVCSDLCSNCVPSPK